VLVVDIGFLRTKLMFLSAEGCEQQLPVLQLGTSDLVRRILRDGQEHGLVEDEFAVIYALERLDGRSLNVGGRRFDVDAELRSARRAVEEELARAGQSALVRYFQRRSHTCRTVAIIGGGVHLLGQGLKDRLEAAQLGIDTVWLAQDPNFLLVEGALRLDARGSHP
jgi:hypothetical protein